MRYDSIRWDSIVLSLKIVQYNFPGTKLEHDPFSVIIFLLKYCPFVPMAYGGLMGRTSEITC